MSMEATPAATDDTTAPSRPRRRWLRWTRRIFKWTAIGVVVARLLLALFLEQIADFGASFAGLSVSWRSSSLSLTGLSLRIEDLVVRDAADDAAPALLSAHEVVADLSTRQLLTGQLAVVDAGLAGVKLTVHQLADGSLRLPAAWLEPAPESSEPEPEPVEPQGPLTFDLPLWIASTRLHDLELDYVDHRHEPPVHHSGKLDVDIANIGFTDRKGSVLIRLHVPQLCDELFVQAEVLTNPDRADVRFQTVVRGFRPRGFDLGQDVYDAIDDARVVDVRLAGDLAATTFAAAPTQPALSGELNLGVALDGIERSSMVATFGPTQPGEQAITTPFSLGLQIDGVVDALQLRDGSLTSHADGTRASATLAVDNLVGRRLRPLLESAGLVLPPTGLDIGATFTAQFGKAQTVELRDVAIAHDGGRLFSLPKVRIADLETDADALRIAAIEIVGPEVEVERQANGDLVFAGLRTTSPRRAPAAEASAEAAEGSSAGAAPTDDVALPKLRIGTIDWSGVRLTYRDAGLEPAAELRLDDLHLHSEGFALGSGSDPNRLTLSFGLPDVVERCAAKLRLASDASRVQAELTTELDAVTLAGLEPWLQPLGIATRLEAGSLRMQARADVELLPDGLALSASAEQIELRDGDTRWFGVAGITGEGLRVSGNDLQVGTWTVREPFVKLHRDRQQRLHAFGLLLGSPAAGAAPADRERADAAPADGAVARTTVARDTEANGPAATLRHGRLQLQGAELRWSTESESEQVFTIGIDADVGADDGTGTAVPIDATISLAEAVDRFRLTASMQRGDARLSLDGELDIAGVHGERLAPLLPPGLRCTLADGSLQATFATELTSGSGKSAIDARVRTVRLADGGTELLAIDDVVLRAPSVGAAAIHVAEFAVTGVRAALTRGPDALELPGFALADAPADLPADVPAPAVAAAATADAARPPLRLPDLRLDALRLELERFAFHDRRAADSVPIEIHTEVTLPEPWVGDPNAERPQPLALQIDGGCAPIGARWHVDLELAPFELAPTADLRWQIDDFDTTQLARISPQLAERLTGEATDLTCSGRVNVALDLRRREPAAFDFGRPFGAEIVLEDFKLHDGERVHASITAIDAIARAIDPRTGSVLLRSLDIDEPIVNLRKDAAGTHAFGFLLPPAPDPAAGEVGDEGEPANRPAPRADEPSGPRAEFAVDRLHLLGLGFDYVDATTSPPTRIHLADSDAEVLRFTTRALDESLPIAFNATLRGGDIELDRRLVSSSFLLGIVGSSVDALTGGKDEHERVERPMLDRLSADGRLVLFPRAKGDIEVHVSRLELAAFRGLAKESGVDLADGLYDADIEIELRGADGLLINSEHVLTFLELSEPPDGPISTYLRLPAPLQTVLFLLRNDSYEQRIPMRLELPGGDVDQGEIASLAVESLTRLISDAVGSAGGRALSTITGNLFGSSSDVPDVHATVDFPAGSPLPAEADLKPLARALAGDPNLSVLLVHELGPADLEQAERLANPPSELIARTVRQLELERRRLESQREPLAAEVVALYAASKTVEANRALERLRRIDGRLGATLLANERALDQLGDTRKRARLRRTRDAARAIAEERLEVVASLLRGRLGKLSEDRIERRPGRGVPVAGIDAGGRVTAVLRRQAASAPKTKGPRLTRPERP